MATWAAGDGAIYTAAFLTVLCPPTSLVNRIGVEWLGQLPMANDDDRSTSPMQVCLNSRSRGGWQLLRSRGFL